MKKVFVVAICYFSVIFIAKSQTWQTSSNLLYSSPSSANVSIGLSTSSGTKLDIGESNFTGTALRLRAGDQADGNHGAYQCLMSYYGGTRYTHAIRTRHQANNDIGNAIDFFVWDYGTDGINDIGSKLVMTLNGGNVGIGTSTPDSKLEVDGKITCEEVEVKNVSADYVFGKDFSLKTLKEVEAFINKNGHLPDVPPASETEKGVNISEFNSLLLQKIEELTLYTIEQEKRINTQQKKIEELQNSILNQKQ